MESSRKRRRRRLRNIIILLLLITGVTIGYTMLSQNLNITGKSRIKNAAWDVHFDNIKVTNNTNVEAQQKPVASDYDTLITYKVNLDKPGDIYEFTVDVVNEGNVDAKLAAVPKIEGVSRDQDVYINYEFVHADNGRAIKKNEIIMSGEKEKFKVRVEFDKTIDASQLPIDIQDLLLTIRMDYEQA